VILYNMITGVLFNHINESFETVEFESPSDVFHTNKFTIIGACVEKNLVMIGLENAFEFPVSNIDSELLSQFVFDEHPCGDLLFIKTNDEGIPIYIDLNIF